MSTFITVSYRINFTALKVPCTLPIHASLLSLKTRQTYSLFCCRCLLSLWYCIFPEGLIFLERCFFPRGGKLERAGAVCLPSPGLLGCGKTQVSKTVWLWVHLLQCSCWGKNTDWNCTSWPGSPVTVCKSCFRTGGPRKEHRTNKPQPTWRIWERSKGDNPETHPIAIKPGTVSHVAEQLWVPLPCTSLPKCPFPRKAPALSARVSSDNSFPSVRQEPTFGVLEGTPLPTTQGIQIHSVLWLIFHCMHGLHLLYPFTCQWTSRLLLHPATVNMAAMNSGVHMSFKIVLFSGYRPHSGIAYPHWVSSYSLITVYVLPGANSSSRLPLVGVNSWSDELGSSIFSYSLIFGAALCPVT